MLRSMTGYGRCEYEKDGRKFAVEIKGVNHRYNELAIKMPRFLNPLEDSLKKLLGNEIFRGKTEVYVSFESLSSDDIDIVLNTTISDKLVDIVKSIKQRYSLKDDISLSFISKFPSVISILKNYESEIDSENKMFFDGLVYTTGEALKNFIAMREKEGEALKNDLSIKLTNIKSLTEEISSFSPVVIKEYYEKMRIRLSEILQDDMINEVRVAQEIALIADKCAIDEEITRLNSHIAQMESILEESGSIGRKLDFLVQEMIRESNTISSKSNNIEITKLIVTLKSEIEKIREQVQNIE